MHRSRGDGPKWVSQLITGGAWDSGEVSRLMEGEEMNRVLSIPLSKHNIRDRVIWNHSRSGEYYTSSWYLTARDMRKNGDLHGNYRGESSRGGSVGSWWKELWSLKMPPRVKLFLWKCLDNALPTRDNLMKRGMKGEECCVLCNSMPETIFTYFD
ncbi:hypothetical protein LIER_28477 [Lithospermum erythrorhizon]|uniref:Reverse transcriptase zinc-binding domain-containing protein n=1 Tax=Lithospermum erythrorhizon TaxID=34254 RepID=A0AAV3RFU7_LITER